MRFFYCSRLFFLFVVLVEFRVVVCFVLGLMTTGDRGDGRRGWEVRIKTRVEAEMACWYSACLFVCYFVCYS
jgi:hypothetical protein